MLLGKLSQNQGSFNKNSDSFVVLSLFIGSQMNLIKLSSAITAITISLSAIPAQAFSIGGNASYTSNGLPAELSVTNEVQIPDNDTQFTVVDPNALQIGSILLEGVLEDFGITENSVYAPVSSYITGFQFLGEAAVFNLDAGQQVFAGFSSNNRFTVDSMLSGNIVDLDGKILGTAIGSFSAVQTENQIGNFSINLHGTPINPDTTTPVPGPSLLLGILGLGMRALRKYNNEWAE